VRTEHYNYFRDYDASIGRYVESDPIGLKGGLNTFGYVFQMPLAKSDRVGLAACAPWDTTCHNAMRAAGLPVPMPFDSPCGKQGGMKFPTFGFGQSCVEHDKCYDRCGVGKLSCDLDFCANTQISCGVFQNAPCRLAALQFCEAVTYFGGGAYANAQAEACKTCRVTK
jgi:hypothetical protein